MLDEKDFEVFKRYKINAMGNKLKEIVENPAYDDVSFEQKIKEMLDAQLNFTAQNKISKCIKQAHFKLPSACIERIDYFPERKLSKDRIERLARCEWVKNNEVVVIISKTGCGKSFICQALGNAACRKQYDVRYVRLADICASLDKARIVGGSNYYEKIDFYKRVELLIVDDFLTTNISKQSVIDLFEIMEARENCAATLVASQLDPSEWYIRAGDDVMADSILNRIATIATYIDLDGPNMREYYRQKQLNK